MGKAFLVGDKVEWVTQKRWKYRGTIQSLDRSVGLMVVRINDKVQYAVRRKHGRWYAFRAGEGDYLDCIHRVLSITPSTHEIRD